jgi:hypothetical protein
MRPYFIKLNTAIFARPFLALPFPFYSQTESESDLKHFPIIFAEYRTTMHLLESVLLAKKPLPVDGGRKIEGAQV